MSPTLLNFEKPTPYVRSLGPKDVPQRSTIDLINRKRSKIAPPKLARLDLVHCINLNVFFQNGVRETPVFAVVGNLGLSA